MIRMLLGAHFWFLLLPLLLTSSYSGTNALTISPQKLPPSPPPPSPPRNLILYRDNNGWCPFCERTWTLLEQTKTPYTEKLINLRSKPEYYLKLVPTTLVPAIQFDISLRKDKKIIHELESETFANVTKIMKRRNPFARLMGKRRVIIWESVQTMMAIEKFLSPQHPGKVFMGDSPTKEKADALLSEVTKAGEKERISTFPFGWSTALHIYWKNKSRKGEKAKSR